MYCLTGRAGGRTDSRGPRWSRELACRLFYLGSRRRLKGVALKQVQISGVHARRRFPEEFSREQVAETGPDQESAASIGYKSIQLLANVSSGVSTWRPNDRAALPVVERILRRGKPPVVVHHVQRHALGA